MTAKLRIGTIFQHHLERSLGTSTVVLGLAEALSKKGLEVNIFSPLEKTRRINSNLMLHNIRINLISLGSYDFARFLYRSHRLARLVVNSRTVENLARQLASATLSYLRKNDIALDIIQGEQEIPSLAAIEIARELGIPSVACFHNVWMEEVHDSGIKAAEDTLTSLTERIVDHANLVITVTPAMLSYIKSNFSVSNAICVPIGAPQTVRRESYDSPYRAVYSGTLAEYENVPLYLKAADIVFRRKYYAKFYVTGKGSDASKLKRLAGKMRLPMEFLWLPKQSYYNFLSTCHIGVIPWAPRLSRKLGFPVKLLDYAASGLAILSTNVGGWTEIIEREQMGILAEASPEDMAEKLASLLDDPEQIQKYGRHAQQYAETETWEKSTTELQTAYLDLLESAQRSGRTG